MRRLYVKIYLAFLAILFFAATTTAFTIRTFFETRPEAEWRTVAVPLATLVADGDIDALAREVDADIAVYEDGALLRHGGRGEVPGAPGREGWNHDHRTGRSSVAVSLTDGRKVVVAHNHDPGPLVHYHIFLPAIPLLLIAAGCYPLARTITRRLEGLERGAKAWGDGDLSVRVDVQGQDEVADVARSFNEAAARVESLLQTQRRMLASASHELRSPLARLRMAVELSHPVNDGAIRDIEELDALIGDLLLSGRLEGDTSQRFASVDFRELLLEEVPDAEAAPVEVVGDSLMLKRLVRNLVENARRHGGGEVSVTLTPEALTVADRGEGIDPDERERIFEPFYRPPGHREGADGGVGLGLFLVRQIATHHGWTVTCEPRDGGGTTFVVRITAA